MTTRSFPVRGGSCYVYPDRLEFSVSGWMKLASRLGFSRASTMFLVLAIALLVAVAISLWIENYLLTLFCTGMVFYYFIQYKNQKNISITSRIDRRAIQKIDYQKAVLGESRAKIIINYRSSKGDNVQRKITLLPPPPTNHSLVDPAIKMLREEGLI